MQRLIDANALNFEKLQDTNGRAVPMNDYIAFLTGAMAAQEIVKNAPTIDAEPVVRCRDCKRSIVNGGDCDGVLVNIRRNHITETNEFVYLYLEYCSNGIKMDGEQECET